MKEDHLLEILKNRTLSSKIRLDAWAELAKHSTTPKQIKEAIEHFAPTIAASLGDGGIESPYWNSALSLIQKCIINTGND